MRIFLAFVWILGTIYATIPAFWLVVHSFTSYWRRKTNKTYLRLVLIWLAFILAAVVITWHWHEQRLYAAAWSWLAWLLFFLLGILTYRRTKHFGRERLIGRSELQPEKHEQRIINTGLYARVRHPVYLGHFCMLTAWAIGSGLLVLFWLWGFAVLTGALMIRQEDKELERRFGDEYRDYRERVPAVIPRF